MPTARATSGGVTLTATAGMWPGDVDIEEALVPIEVRIENASDHKIRISYSDFGLVTETGTRYAALPPYRVEGSVTELATSSRYGPIGRTAFTHRGFYVAPHYAPIYTTLPRFTVRDLYYDPYYYGHYYPYWTNARIRVELPTADMLRLAIPEGVLDENGELEGFLYFEKIPAYLAGSRINFHMELTDAISGVRFATLHIPFVASEN